MPAEGIEQIEDDELRKLVPDEGAQFQDSSFTTDGAPERTGMDEDFDSLSKHRCDETLKAYQAPLNSVRASSEVDVGARTLAAMSIGFSQLSVLWIPWASFIFNYWGAFNPYFNGTENLRVRQYL